MNNFKHFLITRFNLKVAEWNTTRNAEEVRTEEWLEHRFGLFDRYCLPSVINQGSQNFMWFVFFDHDTPEKFRKRVDDIADAYSNFRPLFIDGLNELVDAVTRVIANENRTDRRPYIITTRLDNDDIIHRDFISSIQHAFKPVPGSVIDIRKGYQLSIENDNAEVRRYSNPFNPFISLIERRSDCKTVMSKMHVDWVESSEVIVIDDRRLWIELVHQHNKINTAHVSVKKIADFNYGDFSLNKEDLRIESRYSIYYSNALIVKQHLLVFLVKQLKRNRQIENFARKVWAFLSRIVNRR